MLELDFEFVLAEFFQRSADIAGHVAGQAGERARFVGEPVDHALRVVALGDNPLHERCQLGGQVELRVEVAADAFQVTRQRTRSIRSAGQRMPWIEQHGRRNRSASGRL